MFLIKTLISSSEKLSLENNSTNFSPSSDSSSLDDIGETLVYVNSLDCLAVAINQGSFAKAYNIETGTNWKISIKKSEE